jgi:methionyl-tRNA synthetase
MEKFYITTTIYYVNDKPHIGHALTTIAADVLARFYRGHGADTFFLTGTDEHGAKIAQAAEAAGQSPQEFCDEVSAKFSLTWDHLGIEPNYFVRTTEPRHEKAVEVFLNRLKESGDVYEGEYEGLYCLGHEAFIKESDLVNGLCPDHKTTPQKLKEKNWFFKLSAYGEKILSKIESGEFIIEPEIRKNEVVSFIKQGLEDIAISRPNVKWGIPVPWDKEQTVYVWVDALINYITGVGFSSNESDFKKWWPADIHLIGKDIIKFHCVIWPALLLAIGELLPKKVYAHGFFTVDGQKMSKTIGNVIDPNDWVDKYGADSVRYFLLREVPFGQDGDVSEEKLKGRYESDLANGLGNLVSRVTTLVEKFLDGVIPEDTVELELTNYPAPEINQLITEFKFHEALAKTWEVVAWANKLVDENKLWELGKTDPQKFAQYAKELVHTITQISTTLQPFMPETSQKILDHLAQEKITKIEPLFPRA